jgi:hypothetical protein
MSADPPFALGVVDDTEGRIAHHLDIWLRDNPHEKGSAMTAVKVIATSISSVTHEVPDPTAADAFYPAAFGLGAQLGLRASEAPTTGSRGFTLSLVVSHPAAADGLIGAALDAGATLLKAASS